MMSMKDLDYLRPLRHILWQTFAGTRGGITRVQIIQLLRKRPYNVNQLHEKLQMDYKTIQHHIRVLTRNNIIATENRNRYGSMYFLSPLFERNIKMLDEILDKTGQRKIKR